MITIEEAKKMIGTEFIYYFEDGDSIPAYVKKFDPEVGMTCVSLDTRTKEGMILPENHPSRQEDGTFCVMSTNLTRLTDPVRKKEILTKTLLKLTEIKLTDRYCAKDVSCIERPSCTF